MPFQIENIYLQEALLQTSYDITTGIIDIQSGTGPQGSQGVTGYTGPQGGIESETITTTATLSGSIQNSYIDNSTSYTVTLSAAIRIGMLKNITITTNDGNSETITIEYTDGYGSSQTCLFNAIGNTLLLISTALGWQLLLNSLITDISSVSFEPYDANTGMRFNGNVIAQGAYVTEKGVVYNTSGTPTISDNKVIASSTGLGTYQVDFMAGTSDEVYARAYAINSTSVSYGSELSAFPVLCLAKGTLITLFNGDTKPIEEIEYSDELKVWNFDIGCFDKSKPLWIKVPQISERYNLLTFSDGTTLKTIDQHRIFNKDLGKFTYPMSNDTPIGTNTFNTDLIDITLINKVVVEEPVEYYNIITNYHINMFANKILTSCRYNNIYRIVDMKFVKDNRITCSIDQYNGVSDKYFYGLRLNEQNFEIKNTIEYVRRLELYKK